MKIDIDKISYEYFQKLIGSIKTEIISRESKVFDNYSLSDLGKIGEKELLSIFKSFGFEDADRCVERIRKYYMPGRFNLTYVDFSNLFSKNSSIEKEIIDEIVNRLNDKINDLRLNYELEISKLKSELVFLEKLFKWLYGDISIDNIDYDEVSELILNSDLSDLEKFELSVIIAKKFIENSRKIIETKSQTKIATFEEEVSKVDRSSKTDISSLDEEQDVEQLLEEQNISKEKYQEYFNYANAMLTKYSSGASIYGNLFAKVGLSVECIDVIDFKLEEFDYDLDKESLTLEDFGYFLATVIANIINKSGDIEKNYLTLIELNKIYQLYFDNKSILLSGLAKLEEGLDVLMGPFVKKVSVSKQKKYWDDIEEVQIEIKKLSVEIEKYVLNKERIRELGNLIESIGRKLARIEDEFISKEERVSVGSEVRKIPLKSFVMFEGQNIEVLRN